MDKRLARADRTVACHQSPRCGIEDVNLPQQMAASGAEDQTLAVLDDHQFSMF
ncbi:hypothetical protein D3C84_1232590 [compost metagenome]